MFSEKSILWVLFVLGIILLIFSLRTPPIKDKLLIFMVTAYCSIILGVITFEKGMLSYPVNLFGSYFDSNLLYEFLLLPSINVYYFKTSFRSGWGGIIGQGIIYSIGLTATEVLIEKYTNFIHYKTWIWQYSFISIFLVLFLIRAGIRILNMFSLKKESS